MPIHAAMCVAQTAAPGKLMMQVGMPIYVVLMGLKCNGMTGWQEGFASGYRKGAGHNGHIGLSAPVG